MKYTEEDTYRRLIQSPFEDLEADLNRIGGFYLSRTEIDHLQDEVLAQHNWTVDDYLARKK